MSKTKRRPYTGSKRIDGSCRNHGSCDYCKSNRLARDRRWRGLARLLLLDWLRGRDDG